VIPFTGVQREPEALRQQMRDAFERVMMSGNWILGPEVAAFEAAWADRCGVRAAVGTANGLDAIEIGLRAAGIGPGDEVITTPMTALATVLGITRSGATPVLADIQSETALLDPESIRRCTSSRTKAIVPVHLYGNASLSSRWAALAADLDLQLIEDCAQAHLARCDGRPVGSFGAVAAFSFYPTKNLGAVGDAGALVTDDVELAERARMLRNYGQRDRYHHEVAGLNSRLDELQAALLLVRLEHLQQQTMRRREIAHRYHDEIQNPAITMLDLPSEPDAHVHHLFVVRCEDRELLQRHLMQNNVTSLIHYPIPAHLQPPFVGIVRDPMGLPNSERHARTCVSVPCHAALSDDETDQIIDAMNTFGRR
jgi:dTDP-4-amino-4,6-dideoxygalactose transaminase